MTASCGTWTTTGQTWSRPWEEWRASWNIPCSREPTSPHGRVSSGELGWGAWGGGGGGSSGRSGGHPGTYPVQGNLLPYMGGSLLVSRGWEHVRGGGGGGVAVGGMEGGVEDILEHTLFKGTYFPTWEGLIWWVWVGGGGGDQEHTLFKGTYFPTWEGLFWWVGVCVCGGGGGGESGICWNIPSSREPTSQHGRVSSGK